MICKVKKDINLMLNKEVVYVNKWLRLGCVCVGSIFLMIVLVVCKQEEMFIKVKVVEVIYLIFYVFLYVVEFKGFFKEEGFDVDVNMIWGGDKMMILFFLNGLDIVFVGLEIFIYVEV